MSRPRTYKTQGIVLKHMPLGESDRLLTLHTPDRGKIRAVARGIRSAKSRKSGHLEPLTHVSVSVIERRGLDVITDAWTLRGFPKLRKDLKNVSVAFYLAELIDNFSTEQSPSINSFNLLNDALVLLENSTETELLCRYFEVRLLADSGFGPELYQCVECSTVLGPANHFFSAGSGGVLCPSCSAKATNPMIPVSQSAMKVLRFLRRETYTKVARLHVPQQLMNEMERLTGSYIRFLLEREPKSAKFMKIVTSERLS